MKGQNQNYHNQVHVSSKGKSLMVEKKHPISRETFEVVKKGQDLQQVVELKLEKKIELTVEDHRNQEIVILRILWKIHLRSKVRTSLSPITPKFRLIY